MAKTSGTKEWASKNINFSKGCVHGCRYCYARRMAHRFGWKKDDAWTQMENKVGMANKKYKKHSGWIMSPSSHDITRSNFDLAVQVFTNILEAGNKLLIVSKPGLKVVIDLCEELQPWKELILLRFSIGTLDEKIRKYWEPFAPSIKQRISALMYTFNHGWKNSVSIEPFLDDQVTQLVQELDPYVNHTIWIGPMNKVHVPKELWNGELTHLYSPGSLRKIKEELDTLNNPKIRYKDHFLTKMGKFKKFESNVRREEYKTAGEIDRGSLRCHSTFTTMQSS